MPQTITFTLEDQNSSPTIYNTKAEWEANKRQMANCRPCYAPASEPEEFPCLAIENGQHDDPMGPYQIHYAFIYKFKCVGEPNKTYEV